MTEDPPAPPEDGTSMSQAEAFRQLHESINSGKAAISMREPPIGRKAALEYVEFPPEGELVRAENRTDILSLVEAVDSGDLDSTELSVPESVHQEFAEICATAINDVTVAEVLEQL